MDDRLRYAGKTWLIVIVALLIAGCSSTHTLSDREDVPPFVKDVARGGDAKWKLAPDASHEAKRAWQNRGPIEAISYELRHGQAWWGCKLLDTLRGGALEHQAASVAERRGAAVITVNEVIGKAYSLTSAELGNVVSAICPAQ